MRVNDAALRCASVAPVQQLFECVALLENAIAQVGTVETGDEALRIAKVQRGFDVAAHPLGSGRREREKRCVRYDAAQLRDAAVFRPKLVTPFAHTVRFVYGDRCDVPALQGAHERRQERALRRNVEQAVFAAIQCLDAFGGSVRVYRAVEIRCRDAVRGQCVDLVFHQRDQGRYDERQSGLQKRGQLIAQRLPAAGRKKRDRVAAL